MKVYTCTTDGDGRFVKGLEEGLGTEVERNACPVHLGQTQKRGGKKRTFSDNFFPGVTTKAEKKRCLDAFADDLGVRSSAIRKDLQERCKGNVKEMIAEAPRIKESVIACYTGECGQICKDTPGTGCSGGDSFDNWILQIFGGCNFSRVILIL